MWPEGTVPVVSLCCWTYNHKKFIAEFIQAALKQKTSFPVEIIIHDDASTDGTIEVLKRYEQQMPNVFRNIYQKTNQYSTGGDINSPVFKAVRGEFVALCEGDDYWTDEDKIQKQVDYLINHKHFAGVFHKGVAVDKSGKTISFIWDYCVYQQEYNQLECLINLKSAYPTSALMFRSIAYPSRTPNYFREAGSDYCLDIMLTEYGPLGYQDFEGSAYRQHSEGIWSTLSLAEMNVTMAKRLVALYRNRVLRSRYPVLQDMLHQQLDAIWWQVFNNSLSSWLKATGLCCKLSIGIGLPGLVLWITRYTSPPRFKLRDILFRT